MIPEILRVLDNELVRQSKVKILNWRDNRRYPSMNQRLATMNMNQLVNKAHSAYKMLKQEFLDECVSHEYVNQI